MADVLRIAMIGCGGNARRQHINVLSEHPEAEVVALVDPSAEMLALAREAVPAVADVPSYADHRRMLDSTELDAVAISSPHTLHADQILDSLDAGCHVLTEKPLTTSVVDTKRVIDKAGQTGKVVCVAFQRRFQGMQRFMRSFVRGKGFGTPRYVQSFISQSWLKGTRGTWRQQLDLSGGGQINDTGAHIIDMIFWIMPSRPVEVAAMIDNRGAEVDIDSSVSYRFEDGALGSLAVLGDGPPRVFWEDMTIVGSRGEALFFRKDVLTVCSDGKVAVREDFDPDEIVDHHFIDVVKGRAQNQSPPEDFLPVIAFSEACWESAARGGQSITIGY